MMRSSQQTWQELGDWCLFLLQRLKIEWNALPATGRPIPGPGVDSAVDVCVAALLAKAEESHEPARLEFGVWLCLSSQKAGATPPIGTLATMLTRVLIDEWHDRDELWR